ncbi:hypothetical protein POX_b02779 [Penicillium oxalicum]|uniref:hypothetical protein n=1 Tax=Penicillium oxalicum TaxID=69781 RepID=UPI0020B6C871|nr:hypothetical protein POX_b02779 [Penicillium oxalicum]KAI2792737.1 hypothetical protein POX_b02779 [Penicillium oxalicum]
MTTQGPLTQWLLAATPQSLKRATTHPFLAAAGSGTVSKDTLSQWLSQDRLYAQSYIRFIGMLLAKIRLPAQSSSTPSSISPPPLPPSSSSSPRRPMTIEQSIVDILIDALVNIRAELHFFETTAAEYGLDLTALPACEGLETRSASSGQSVPIATSAGILTTGPGSCPGFTGRVCSGTSVSVGGAESGEIEDDVSMTKNDLDHSHQQQQQQTDSDIPREQLHKLCKAQGECQTPGATGTGDPTMPNPPVSTPDCEPCQPSRLTTGPPLEQGPVLFTANPITRAYIDMFMSAASPGVSPIEGITVLWATEICYLRSWRYAASYGRKKKKETAAATAAAMTENRDADGGALRDRFIPNWSSREFEEFVNRIGDVLDEMVGSFKGAEEAEGIRVRCLDWWRQVVWLEERFWPSME